MVGRGEYSQRQSQAACDVTASAKLILPEGSITEVLGVASCSLLESAALLLRVNFGAGVRTFCPPPPLPAPPSPSTVVLHGGRPEFMDPPLPGPKKRPEVHHFASTTWRTTVDSSGERACTLAPTRQLLPAFKPSKAQCPFKKSTTRVGSVTSPWTAGGVMGTTGGSAVCRLSVRCLTSKPFR